MNRAVWKKILKTLGLLVLIAGVIVVCFQFTMKVAKNKDKKINRLKTNFQIMGKWMEVLENEKSISTLLRKRNIETIGIYGAGLMGKHAITQLQRCGMEIKYVIDKNIFNASFNDVPVCRLKPDLPKIDAIIVTPVWDYENIKNELEKVIDCQIISLETLLEEANV